MRSVLFLFLSLFFLQLAGYAQQEKLVIHILEQEQNSALSDVRVMDSTGKLLATSDLLGYIILPVDIFAVKGYLLMSKEGFKTDTFRNMRTVVHLSRLAVSLPPTTISAATVSRLFQIQSEFVVDYGFAEDKILAVTYSGNNGGKAKLFLLDHWGIEIARCKLPDEPESLYKSCVGNYYVVCKNQFFPIIIKNDRPELGVPYDIKFLRGLQQCELMVKGNQYYRIGDKTNFRTVYGMIAAGDSVFRPFASFEEPEVARASFIEMIEILSLYEHYQFREAARRAKLRRMWDNGTLSHINMPLFAKGDTLLVFDYSNKEIDFYSLSGDATGNTPIRFEWKQSQQFRIIKDELQNKIYIHRFGNQGSQTLEEMDINTGSTKGVRYIIDRPFVSNVYIRNGLIYFLWQDQSKPSTQQLWVQKINGVLN
jgi:hypothetical protein